MTSGRRLVLAFAALAAGLCGTGCAPPTRPGEPAAYGLAADSARLRTRLDAALGGLEAHGFSGAVMVARDGEPVLSKGYGMADRTRRLAVTDRTLLQLGSVSKQFTAAAILKLQMQGRLHVSDPIGRHLEHVPADKRAITIHHLLTHTSGLPRRVGVCSSDSAALGRDDYVRQVLAARLRTAPGTAHLYSNDGYGLLGAIVERASGVRYEAYLREQLFAPAGMTRTGYSFGSAALADAARGYGRGTVFLGNLTPTFRNASGPAWCNRASGGLLSTAQDMYRWYVALRGSAVLSERAKTALWTRHVAESRAGSSFHGYGWTLLDTPRRTQLAAHDGSLSGYFTADLHWYLDEDVVVFVAANTVERPAPEATRAIVKVLFR